MSKSDKGGSARKGSVAKRRKPRRKSWTKERREQFLSTLAETANVTAASRAANMCPQGAYAFRKRDAAFRAAWHQALSEGYDRLELIALERAMFGTEKEVWHSGKKTGTMRNYSDSLILGLLRMHRASVRPGDAPREDEDEEAERLRAELAAKFEEMSRRMNADDAP